MPRFEIAHKTTYDYDSPVMLGPHKLLLRPRDGHDLQIETFRLSTTPESRVTWSLDALDNSVGMACFDEVATTSLTITSEMTVNHRTAVSPPLLPDCPFPFAYSGAELPTLEHYRRLEGQDPAFYLWVASLQHHASAPGEARAFLQYLSNIIHHHCDYEVREEPGVQSTGATLDRAKGSCRDYAWLFVAAARHVGLAARFVSGYCNDFLDLGMNSLEPVLSRYSLDKQP